MSKKKANFSAKKAASPLLRSQTSETSPKKIGDIFSFRLKSATYLIFGLYFIIGLLVFNDYGLSHDQLQERETSLANYVHVMGSRMEKSDNPDVVRVAQETPELMHWYDKYYGAALQSMTILAEHVAGFNLPTRTAYLIRYLFVFLNYFAAAIMFHLILRRRFTDELIPLLGVLIFILSPRFFGESFYNIKDILFYSWFFITLYFVLRWLEDMQNLKFFFLTALTLAITTNTRILGLSLLLLTCFFAVVKSIKQKDCDMRILGRPIFLMFTTFACYIAITPVVWEDPIKQTINIFKHFVHFAAWNGHHLYMGEMISKEVPWHYIPVWMGVTVPILYIALFFVGSYVVGVHCINYLRKKGTPHLYDLFFFALFYCTLLGYILLKISMYEGWRQAYSIYCPFLFIAVLGIKYAFDFFHKKRPVVKKGFTWVVTLCLVYNLGWIVFNHPYQYVYFNSIGRRFAEENFELDYWQVSRDGLIRYALAHDDRSQIRLDTGWRGFQTLMFTEEEKARVVEPHGEPVDYFVRMHRGPHPDYHVPYGYEEVKSINVNGIRIATLFKRI